MDSEPERPFSRPAHVPIPADPSAATDQQIRALIESWAAVGDQITFADVIGHEPQVAAMQRLATLIHLSASEPERLTALGVSTGFLGAAVCGPSGSGKTMLARALCSATGDDRRVYILPTAELTPALLTRVYQVLGNPDMPPSIVIIDEAERLIARYGFQGADDELRIAFLAAIDGMAGRGRAATIGLTTLEPNEIHSACRRPGRLSPILSLSLPTRADRRRMWALELGRRPIGEVDVDHLAEITEGGWSGSEIAGAVEGAAVLAACSGRSAIEADDLSSIITSRFLEEDRAAKLPAVYADAAHEAGHATWAAIENTLEAVIDVRLMSRGEGRTIALSHGSVAGDHDTTSPAARLGVTLAGARHEAIGHWCGPAAEWAIAGEIGSGANNDRFEATKYAAMMIDMQAASSYSWHEHQVGGDCNSGSDAMRVARWRDLDSLGVELRGEAERWVAAHTGAIRHFAGSLFAAPDHHLAGADLHQALRSALAIE